MRYSSRAAGSKEMFSGAVTLILRFLEGGAMFAQRVWCYKEVRMCMVLLSPGGRGEVAEFRKLLQGSGDRALAWGRISRENHH